MGCCGTKPRVVKGDEAQEPIPIPSTRWNKETVDEAIEAQNNVEADLNHDIVKGKDVLHQTNKLRSLSILLKEEEMQMLDKTNNAQESMESLKIDKTNNAQESMESLKIDKTNNAQESMESLKIEPEMHASTESEKLRKKMMQRQSSKANHEIEHHAKPTEHNKRPELAYIAPENYESLKSIETKSIPEDSVITNQQIEDPAKAIERNHKPALVDHEKIEAIQSTEDKSAPKVIVVKKIEEPAKPIEQIVESDPLLDAAPKTSTDTDKNQKIEGLENLVDHKGDPIDGFPGNIDVKSETTKII